jgi:hypothetical protein
MSKKHQFGCAKGLYDSAKRATRPNIALNHGKNTALDR